MRTNFASIDALIGLTRGQKRDYRVTGSIAFVLKDANIEADVNNLAESIFNEDGAQPWIDVMPPMEEAHSINYLTKGEKQVNNMAVREVTWWFTIMPTRVDMTKSQIYAYKKYLDELAQRLTKRGIPNVCKIRSMITVVSLSEFCC